MDKEELVDFLYYFFYDEQNQVVDLSDLDFSKYGCDVDISGMVVGESLFQDHQKVGWNLNQEHQQVEGDLDQGWQEVKGDLDQCLQTVNGDLYISDRKNKVKGKVVIINE